MIIFGPVPSRRLGRSLGINNIPPKNCTYSCIYCQLGRTKKMTSKRQNFYTSDTIIREVEKKITQAQNQGEKIDYVTFVSDGEPTLDINLGETIEKLKQFQINIAVITNSSLMWREEVRESLQQADWVSVKIDSVLEHTWRRINRPEKSLSLHFILEGISEFSYRFQGRLVTETMLVREINDNQESIQKTADFIARLAPSACYISIPIRPPAENWVKQPKEKALINAHQIFSNKVDSTELLIGYEGNAFASTGNIQKDLLSITAVHPMRRDAVERTLDKTNGTWNDVLVLIKKGLIVETEYQGKFFYSRKLSGPVNKNPLGIRME